MYRKLSCILFSSISFFSVVSIGITTINAKEQILDKSQNVDSLDIYSKTIVVKNEDEFINALKDQTVTDIVIEGNITLFKNISLSSSDRNVKVHVGSKNAQDSSLVIIQGTKINGANKLTFVKENSSEKPMIEFKKVMSTHPEAMKTRLVGVNIVGKENEFIINNTIDNLSIQNVVLENGILFKNAKRETQIVDKTYFMNSSLTFSDKANIIINEDSIVKDRESIHFKGHIGPTSSSENLRAIAVDSTGKIFEASSLSSNRRGDVSAYIENLNQATKYDLYIVELIKDGDSTNVILSKPVNTSTFMFKTLVQHEGINDAKIKIIENDLDGMYYPLYLILKIEGQAFKKIELPNSKNLLLNLTGLKENSNYTYEIVSYAQNKEKIIDNGNFKTLASDKNNNVSNSQNSSIISYDLLKEDLNKSNIEDTKLELFLNDNLKTLVKAGKNFNTNVKGLDVKVLNDKLVITNLIPSKEYSNLKIYFDLSDGRRIIINCPTFKTLEETSDINEFVKSVYFNAFNRYPDEEGFLYWVDRISKRDITCGDFVRNLLSEQEFSDRRPTTKSKIEGLYSVIVNRQADEQGLKYWIDKYDTLISKGCSEDFSLMVIVDNMVNEDEFKNKVQKLEKSIKII